MLIIVINIGINNYIAQKQLTVQNYTMQQTEHLYDQALSLLKQLIATPALSREEDKTASLLEQYFTQNGMVCQRYLNNVWSVNKNFDSAKPCILLNSHHDTVKPNPDYSLDPFAPIEKDGRLFGLGSNDAGGCLVSLIAAFQHFYPADIPFNLVIACTAEEEVSGVNGIEALLSNADFLQTIQEADLKAPEKKWCGIVGEPTQTQLAVAEKGLLVLDVTTQGRAGHAAREEGENAIYKALREIEWFRNYTFDKRSAWLGKVKMTVTAIHTENRQHNVVPASCHYTVDIRFPECYTHPEILAIIQDHIDSEVKPRSFRLKSSGIDVDHPLVAAGIKLGKKPYGSPTSSDKAFMPFPTLKCGPGDSARSHTADEFIYIEEIHEGIEFYIDLLNAVKF